MTFDATWLWSWLAQGTVAVALVTLALRLRPRTSASTRALVWLTTLMAIPCMGLALGASIEVRAFAPSLRLPFASVSAPMPVAAGTDAAGQAMAWLLTLVRPVTTVVAVAWMSLALLRVTRLGMEFGTLVRWRARCRTIDPSAWHRLPAWTCLRAEGRRPDVVVSLDVRTPCVLGLWRPVIALPPSALAMRCDALDAVLVHEYAHIQRRDDITQFAQHVVTALCALHPAAWWASRMLTLEREAACDDWAVLLAMPTRTYASSLVTLAGGGSLYGGALQVGVAGGRSQLEGRVRRLLDAQRRRQLRAPSSARIVVPVAVVLIAGLVTSAGQPRRVTRAPVVATADARSTHAPIVAEPASPSVVSRPAALVASTPGARDTAAASQDRVAVRSEHDAARIARAEDAPAVVTARQHRPAAESAGALPRRTETSEPLVPSGTPMVGLVTPSRSVEPGMRGTLGAESMVSRQEDSSTESPRPSADVGARVAAPFTTAGLSVADAGVSIGRGAARGGVATGSFFTRLGKRVARTF
jgi:beta-lactamase regulating signal transducer with metallopeptidase domain